MSNASETATMMPTVRDRPPSVHSLVGIALEVPDLAVAETFYREFGLDLKYVGSSLELRAKRADPASQPAVVITKGHKKRLHQLVFAAYAEELARIQQVLRSRAVDLVETAAAAGNVESISFRDPEGILVRVVADHKRTPDERRASVHPAPDGWRHSPARSTTIANPFRLGHAFLFTSDLERSTAFYRDVLGLGLSDGNDHVAFLHARHGSDHHIVGFAQSTAPGFHHFSFEVENIDQIGIGGQHMAGLGHRGWGFGRHVAGSNWFWYVQDPWGSWAEYFCDIDFVEAGTEVPRRELAPEDSVYLWGPEMPADFIHNYEADSA